MDTGIREEALTAIVKLMENDALREEAKHALQLLIAQEVREAITGSAQQALREAVHSGWDEARKAADKINRADLIEEAVKRILKDKELKPWELAKKIEGWQERVAKEAIVQARTDTVWQVVNVLLQEERPALVQLCQEVINREANKVLVEQIAWWRGQTEDLQRRVSQLEGRATSNLVIRG